MTRLTHLDHKGAARMVDVGGKPATAREATASGRISMSAAARAALSDGKKGDALAVARVAGIIAAKRASDLIPLCHPITLSSVTVDFSVGDHGVTAIATARTTGQTGVEMEALTAVSLSLLTLYDMVKSVDLGMTISDLSLVAKSGGRSGDWRP